MRYFKHLLAVALSLATFSVSFAAPQRLLNLPVSSGTNGPARCTVAIGPLVGVSAIAFSPDGKTLAVGGYKEVILWDLVNATLLKRIGQGHLSETVRALAFRPDGTLLAVGEGLPGRSGAVRLFNLSTGEPVAEWDGPKDVVDTVAFSPDGKLIAAGGFDPVVRVWDVDTRKLVATLQAHHGSVLSVNFSTDGAWLSTASTDASALIWDVKTWKSLSPITQAGPVNFAAFGPSGEFLALAVGGSTGRGVRIRPVDYPEPPEPAPTPTATPTPPLATGTAAPVTTEPKPAAKPAATATPTPKKPTGQPGRLIKTDGGTPLMVLWNRQANKIYAPCTDKTIKVCNPSGGIVATLTGHDDWVYCAALSPDGSRLASGSGDGTIKLWNTADNRLLATLVQLAPLTSQWLILTPQGRFASSNPEAIQWKTAEAQPTPPEQTAPLQNPEAVRQALNPATKPPAPGVSPKP